MVLESDDYARPDKVTQEMVIEAISDVQKKKNLAGLGKVEFEMIEEDLSVQTLYIVPYTEEAETIASLYEYMEINRLQPNGNHHEIYLNDPRRVSPEKLKTIIRQPVKKQ